MVGRFARRVLSAESFHVLGVLGRSVACDDYLGALISGHWSGQRKTVVRLVIHGVSSISAHVCLGKVF